MSQTQSTTQATNHTTDEPQIDARDVRAITEDIQLHPHPEDGKYRVYGSGGDEYIVALPDETCTCMDYQKREPEGGCKHIRKVQFATGARDIREVIGQLNAGMAALREQIADLRRQEIALKETADRYRDVIETAAELAAETQGDSQ